jgi:signal transduction histidine kinase
LRFYAGTSVGDPGLRKTVQSREGRVEAALQVLRGASVNEVAEARGVEPEIVLRWVDLFCEGGEARLTERGAVEADVRDRFLTLIAHEFRTPLAIIGGWVETLLEDDLDRTHTEEALNALQRQVSHLERIARDALDAGAVARGQLRLIVAPVKLRELIAGVLASIHDPRIELEPGDEVEVVADGARLEQVVGGVVEHARRLQESEPVRVAIEDDDPGHVTVRASVRGRGLAIGEAAALLEPYGRSDTSFGTGLGLYLSRALLVAHGGEIGLRSEQGTTVFWFRVPRQGPDMGPLVQRSH